MKYFAYSPASRRRAGGELPVTMLIGRRYKYLAGFLCKSLGVFFVCHVLSAASSGKSLCRMCWFPTLRQSQPQ